MGSPEEPGTTVGQSALLDISVHSILRQSGPRLLLDAGGPLLCFYVGWKLENLVAGIAMAGVAGITIYSYERHQKRKGLVSGATLGFVLIQAIVGLTSNSARAYLALPALVNAVLGLAFLASVLASRPLAGEVARELVPLPAELRSTAVHQLIFRRLSVIWGVYLLILGSLLFVALPAAGINIFIEANVGFGVLTIALLAWSIAYALRGLRGLR